MSGGHYGYQHHHDAADYAGRACGVVELRNIAVDLEGEGYEDVAKTVLRFRADMEAYTAKGEALDQLYVDLKYIMKVLDLYKSGDNSRDNFVRAAEARDVLQVVFENGELKNETTFADVRARAAGAVPVI